KIIATLKATKNQTKTSRVLGIRFSRVNRIIHLSVKRGLARRIPHQYTSLSMDEKSFRKGHTYVTV
ncbi:MAG: ISL3 family transposase, partial [Bacteroidota bacterium]